MATGRGSGNQRLINEFQQEYGACARNDQKCCSCTQDDCSACNCHTTRCTSCKNQNCKFKKDIKETIDKMTDKEMHFALVDILDLNLNGFIETVHEIMPRTQENSQSCCNRRNSKKNVKYAIIHMEESDKRNVLKQVVEQDCSDPVLDAIFMNVGTDNNKLPDWYKQKRCCSCTHDDCSACNCHTTGCTSCRNQNCKFKKDIKKAIDSMRSEQTRGALNELMAVQGIANLNQAILGHRFPRDDHEKACSKCKTSNMYDSECSDEDCTYKKKLEEKIRRMDADEGKAALRLILNSNSLNKVEDAVFWNVSNDMVPTWYGEKIKNIDEFKRKAVNMAVFIVRRKKMCSSNFTSTEFLTFRSRSSDEFVTVIYYKAHVGGLKLTAERYELDDECLNTFINFKKDQCYQRMHLSVKLSQFQESNPESYKELIHVVGEIGSSSVPIGLDQPPDQSPVRQVLRKMNDFAEREDRKKSKANRYLVTSLGFFATLLISLISVAVASTVRQAHIRIMVDMFLEYHKHGNLSIFEPKGCNKEFGNSVIDATKKRIDLVMKEDFSKQSPTVKDLIYNITRFLEFDTVCDTADHLGRENFRKTSLDLLISWFLLHSSFIIVYERFQLKSKAMKNNDEKYFKAFLVEVVGWLVPMISSVITGTIIQHYERKPTVMYVFVVCTTAAITRIIAAVLVNCCYSPKLCNLERCLYSQCKFCKVLTVLLSSLILLSTILMTVTGLVFLYKHYQHPKKTTPFF